MDRTIVEVQAALKILPWYVAVFSWLLLPLVLIVVLFDVPLTRVDVPTRANALHTQLARLNATAHLASPTGSRVLFGKPNAAPTGTCAKYHHRFHGWRQVEAGGVCALVAQASEDHSRCANPRTRDKANSRCAKAGARLCTHAEAVPAIRRMRCDTAHEFSVWTAGLCAVGFNYVSENTSRAVVGCGDGRVRRRVLCCADASAEH
uniref:Uncharacterized protein n=1 Tax=Calcidiscus leptoporus TaxID=127549 RepID=A0A7S0NQ35_9EUKA|mmetsp:Transcript_13316/g.30606  ORF Transcript_13316/g.30606 Transcript_13316/m.30606 type:complete len:205 (+) Transcript_13316:163-777(+)|eukprot:CAMPEP_0119376100 /NCGR_PEP_ID=MMETSP1334-20130426/38854_1 /TAXON_ID=127549 /ORGANISM="Calcidiscus leptoporus, Strain RCC1130" /LENGTH=204 /DNA_ID=CAMNT_0007394581 /DNA_START=151 /DNA_END=765 /DNA_ORIENTATION=+